MVVIRFGLAATIPCVLRCVQNLSTWSIRGASVQSAITVEAVYAALRRFLNEVRVRAWSFAFSDLDRGDARLPAPAGRSRGPRLVRWCVRRCADLLLAVARATRFLAVVSLSWSGLIIVVLAMMTAFPRLFVDAAAIFEARVSNLAWSADVIALIATVVASLIAVLGVSLRMALRQRARASREFRGRRAQEVLGVLHAESVNLYRLSQVLRRIAEDSVAQYRYERRNAQRWYDAGGRVDSTSGWGYHLDCDSTCLNDRSQRDLARRPSPDLQSALEALDIEALEDVAKSDLPTRGVLSRRAHEGIQLFWGNGIRESVTPPLVPGVGYWQARRIEWQHSNILRSDSNTEPESDGCIRLRQDITEPKIAWLEDAFLHQTWRLVGMSRELVQLAEFGWKQGRPGTLESLSSAWTAK